MDADTPTEIVIGRVARVCGIFLILMGSLGLLGWGLGLHVLTGVRMEYIPMAPNTALLVVLLGFALFITTALPSHRATGVVVSVLLCVCILVAGLTLASILSGTDLGIDSFFVVTTGTLGLVPVGRMSPVSAGCFILGSCAVLLLRVKKREPAALIGTILTLISGVILIGYLYGAPLLYGGTVIPVALTTAIAFGVLGVGLVAAAGPAIWPLSSVSGDSTRARLLRGLLPVMLLVVLLAHWSEAVITGNADSTVVLASAVTVLATLIITYFAVSWLSRSIGSTIDQFEREQKNAEDALAESERKYRNLYQYALVGLFETSLKDAMVVACNERYATLAGFLSVEDAIGKDIVNLYVNPDDRAEVSRILRETGSIENHVVKFRNQSTGKTFWGQFSARYNYHRDIAEGTIIDITAQKDAEDLLRENATRLSLALGVGNAGVWQWNLETNEVLFDDRFHALLGYSPGELPHTLNEWMSYHNPDDVPVWMTKAEAYIRGDIPIYESEHRIRTRAGEWAWVFTRGQFVNSPELGPKKMFVGIAMNVTGRKQAEEELRFKNALLSTQQETSPDGILIVDENGKILSYNQKFIDMWKIPPDLMASWMDEPVLRFVVGQFADPETFLSRVRYLYDHKDERSSDELQLKDGRILERLSAPMLGELGKYYGRVWYFRDITDRKRAEAALMESEERFRTMIDWTYDWEYWIGPDRDPLYVSPSAQRITGYSTGEFTADKFLIDRIIHPDDRSLWQGHLSHHATADPHDTHGQVEFRIIRKDGIIRWIGHVCRPIYAENGRWIGTRVSNRDITDRKLAEDQRRETNEYLKNLIDYANAPIIVWDKGFRITRFNHAFERMTGRIEQDVIGQHLEILFPETSRDASFEQIRKTLAGERWEIVEIPILHISGETRMVLWNSANIVDSNGMIISTIAQGQDITERKMAVDALRQSEEKYRVLFTRMIEGSALHEIVYDSSGNPVDYRIIDANPAFESIIGIKRDAIIGKTSCEAYGVDTPPYLDTYAQVAATGQPAWFEVYFAPLKKHFAISAYSPIKGKFATIFEDVTERKQAEELREHLIKELEQKNAELERFTYTVSHDLKSPLITIKGFAGLIEEDVRQGDQIRLKKDLHRIMAAAGTMQELLADVLELARVGKIVNPPEKIAFGTIAEEAVDLLAGPLAERNIEVEIEPELPMVNVDHARIREVLINLLENAIKFTGNRSDPAVRIGVDMSGTEPVFFVQDNGIGIDPRYLERIFNIFERLDASMQGTGIGLTIARRIIEVHGGEIWAESEGIGKGTTFRFTLPGIRIS